MTNVRVIKLGGSLLEWSDLAPNFRCWVSAQVEAANIVVIGGGSLVEALRKLDARHKLGNEVVHWLAVRAMGVTARLLAHLLGQAAPAVRLEELRLSDIGGIQVFDVEQFLRHDVASQDSLPYNWTVTSDSIAARVAKVLEAEELVLLKSTMPAGPATLTAWSRSGIVDPHFPRAAAGLSVRLVNLRDDNFSEMFGTSGP